MKRRIILIILILIAVIATGIVVIKNNNVKTVYNNIVNNETKDDSAVTVRFHKNITGTNVSSETVEVTYTYSGQFPLYVPDNWTNPGYVLAGWITDLNYPDAVLDLHCELKKQDLKSDYYAKWVPVNQKYGNVIFIGDSYINSSVWHKQVAEQLGLGLSYTYFNMPGSGFLAQVPAYGDYSKWLSSTLDFSSLLALADRAIGNNSDVKLVVVLGGYNDKNYTSAEILGGIRGFNGAVQERFPNAHVAIGMAGTDFLRSNIQQTLQTEIEYGYKVGAQDFGSKGHYLNANDSSAPNASLSHLLVNFNDYNDSTFSHACCSNGKTFNPDTMSCTTTNADANKCKYWIEEGDLFAGPPVGWFGIHPSYSSGTLIAQRVAPQLQKINTGSNIVYNYTNLASLSVSNYSLNKQFNANDTSYSLTVPSNVSSININATKAFSGATITGTGTCNLSYGSNSCVVTVSHPGYNQKKYTITVTRERPLSSNTNLSSLRIEGYELSCSNNDFHSCFATINDKIKYITVVAVTEDPKAKAQVVGGNSNGYISLREVINVVVTAEDKTTDTYTIHVGLIHNEPDPTDDFDEDPLDNEHASDTILSSLSVEGYDLNYQFTPSRRRYEIHVPSSVNSVNISAQVPYTGMNVYYSDSVGLYQDVTEIPIRVKAIDGTTDFYYITVYRAKTVEDIKKVTITRQTNTGLIKEVVKEVTNTTPKTIKSRDTSIIKVVDSKLVPIKEGHTILEVEDIEIEVYVPSIDNSNLSDLSVVNRISIKNLVQKYTEDGIFAVVSSRQNVDNIDVIIEDDDMFYIDGEYLIAKKEGKSDILLGIGGEYYNLSLTATLEATSDTDVEVKGDEVVNPKTGVFNTYKIVLSVLAISIVIIGIVVSKRTLFKKI